MNVLWSYIVCGLIAALPQVIYYQFVAIPRVRRETREEFETQSGITRHVIQERKATWMDAYTNTDLKKLRNDKAYLIRSKKARYISVGNLVDEFAEIDVELKRRSDEAQRKRDPLEEFDAVYAQLLENTDKKELE